ncbi:MAG: internalization-related competence protein ComEC/Rec2, competence protein ComEC protein [Candidatus Kaiserbacteria bacterium]|nr:internalization-related competence protein ComEC/Rec2, competence protein ComEC protein [Candidatus Kaiserbacteria bacterium]
MTGVMVWAALIGCVAGIILSLVTHVGFLFAALLFVVACVSMFCSRLFHRYSFYFLAVTLCCVGMGIGVIRGYMVLHIPVSKVHTFFGQRVLMTGDVVLEPDERDTGMRVTLAAHSIVGTSTSAVVDERVLVVLPPHSDIGYGDHITITGTVTVPKPFATNGGKMFDYPGYLHAQGIDTILSFANISADETGGGKIIAAVLHIKKIFLEGEHAVLPEPQSSLAGGILVGDKRSIGKDLSAAFQRASLTHILVLSGYNITVVVDWLINILSRTPRIVQSGSALGAVSFFIIISGGSASAVRAGCMTLIALYARISSRMFDALRALGLVAVGMLLVNPLIILYDPSFQLSFLATLGLVLCSPYVAPYCFWITERFGIRELVVATCATQSLVAPYILYTSGTLSLVALPANILVLIVMPLAMGLSACAGILGVFFGSSVALVAYPAYLVLSYILSMTQFFAAFPFASATFSHIPTWLIVLWYLALGSYIGITSYKKTTESQT